MKRIIIATIAVLALCTSCNFLDTDKVYINATYLLAPEAGGTFQAELYASGAWTATISAPDDIEMSITPTSGNGSTMVTIDVAPYVSDYDYSLGYIVLECGKAKTSFPVYQMKDEFLTEVQEGNAQVIIQ